MFWFHSFTCSCLSSFPSSLRAHCSLYGSPTDLWCPCLLGPALITMNVSYWWDFNSSWNQRILVFPQPSWRLEGEGSSPRSLSGKVHFRTPAQHAIPANRGCADSDQWRTQLLPRAGRWQHWACHEWVGGGGGGRGKVGSVCPPKASANQSLPYENLGPVLVDWTF